MATRAASAAPTDFGTLRNMTNALFDQLEVLRKDADQRQAVVNTLNDADRIKADAQAYADELKAKAEKVMDDANSVKSAADAELAAATETRNGSVKDAARLKSELAELQKSIAAANKAHADRMAQLDAKEAAIAARESKAVDFENSLNARQKALNDRLDSLRSVTA